MTFDTALLLGAGSIGKRHAKFMADRYKRLLIVDPSVDSRAWVAANFDSAETYETLGEGLDALDGQTVTAVVATLGPLHRDNVSQLIEYGVRHIYCEKPLATSIADGYYISELATRTNCRLLVGLQRRYSGVAGQIRSFATDYLGGEPVSIVGHGGAQCLITTGMHWIDLSVDIFRSFPARVSGLGVADRMNPRGSDLDMWQGTATWEFSGQRMLALTYSNRSSVDGFLHIYCPLGRIDLCPDGAVRAYRRRDSEIERDDRITRTGEAMELTELVVHSPVAPPFLQALDEIESEELLTYPVTEAARSLESALGALASFDAGQVIDLPINSSSDFFGRRWAVT